MNDQMIAARVIARLKVMYPAYAKSMDNDPEMMKLALDEWITSLKGIGLDKISGAFDKLRSNGTSFCPSIPEFVSLCGGRPKPWWTTIEGIEQRGAELGVEKNPRADLFRLEVLAAAQDQGEFIPLEGGGKKEELHGAVKQLAASMGAE